MIVTAWNNGGSGYGFKLAKDDVRRFFSSEWRCIYLHLPGEKEALCINIDKASFWNDTCRELIHKCIGEWLSVHGHIPWPNRKPPKFEMKLLEGNHFILTTP